SSASIRPPMLDASTSTVSAPPVRDRSGVGICTRIAIALLSLLDLQGLVVEGLPRLAEDPGRRDRALALLDPEHHVHDAVREALGRDLAVGLGRTRRMVGVAVVIADDVEAAVAGGALDADEVLGRDPVEDPRRLDLTVHDLLDRLDTDAAVPVDPSEEDTTHLEGIAPTGMGGDGLDVGLPDPQRGGPAVGTPWPET